LSILARVFIDSSLRVSALEIDFRLIPLFARVLNLLISLSVQACRCRSKLGLMLCGALVVYGAGARRQLRAESYGLSGSSTAVYQHGRRHGPRRGRKLSRTPSRCNPATCGAGLRPSTAEVKTPPASPVSRPDRLRNRRARSNISCRTLQATTTSALCADWKRTPELLHLPKRSVRAVARVPRTTKDHPSGLARSRGGLPKSARQSPRR